MAFKMTPGRGSFAKTGHGVPSPFKQTDDVADKIQRELNRRKNNIDTERTAYTDSIAVRKKILDDPYFDKKSKGDQNIAGSMGGEAANAARRKNPNNVYIQVEKDANTGKSKRVSHDRRGEQLKKEYDKEQARIHPEDKGIKNPRKSSPAKQTKDEDINAKVSARIRQRKNAVDNERSAVSDSTAVSNKAFNSGYFNRKNSQDRNLIGNLSMEAANATRKKNPNNGYNQVERDATGKLKKVGYDRVGFRHLGEVEKRKSPVEQTKSTAKKSSPAKQTKTTAKKMEQPMAKGTSRGSIQAPKSPKSETTFGERTLERNGIRGDLQKVSKDSSNKETQRVYKDSPAKQLGRQAVTKMGGKKTPAKMKKC